MVDVGSLLSTLPRAATTAATVSIKLDGPLPKGLPPNLTVTVVASQPDGRATLQLPNGTQLKATLSPPLASGSQLALPPAATGTANLTQLAARLLPAAPTQPATFSVPPPPTTTTPSSLSITPLPLANLPQALAAAVTTTQPIVTAATAATPAPTASTVPLPTAAPSPLPIGPVAIQTSTLPPTTAANLVATLNTTPQPLTATVTQPSPNQPSPPPGFQPATLSLPNQPTPLPLLVNTGQTLPTGTTLSLALTPPSATPASPSPLPATALLLGATPPATAPATVQPTQPFTPPPLSALKVLLSPPSTSPASPLQPLPTSPGPQAARVLAPPATPLPTPSSSPTPAVQPLQQPILLANGQQAVLQSPVAIPAGSIIVADITTNPVAPVIRLEPAGTGTSNSGTPQQAPASATAPLPANLAPGTTLTGLVTAQTPAKQQVALTITEGPFKGQTLTVATPQQLPLESRLTVTLQANGAANVVTISLPPGYTQSHALTTLTQQWPTLQQALAVLSQNQPAAAATFKQGLPQLAALGATLLPYIEGLTRGDPARAFDRTSTQVLRALGIDFTPDLTQLQTLTQPTPEGWRGIIFPYLENPQGDPRQGGFFWRRQKDDDNPSRPASTRFVVELGLSQLGDVQLDGLLNTPELWLKLRRSTPPEEGFTENLQKLVAATLAGLNLTGGISVETTTTFEVSPIAEILAHAHATLATEV